MIIDLSEIKFTNDFYSVTLPDTNVLVLNKLDESLTISTLNTTMEIHNINVSLMDSEGNSIDCPCVIGMGNDILKIETDYTEWEGKVLTSDNMKYCTINVYEL